MVRCRPCYCKNQMMSPHNCIVHVYHDSKLDMRGTRLRGTPQLRVSKREEDVNLWAEPTDDST